MLRVVGVSIRALSAIRAVTLSGEGLTQHYLEVGVDVRSCSQLMLTMRIGAVHVWALSLLRVIATEHCFGKMALEHVVLSDRGVQLCG